jgi:hypothetical protein
MDEEECAEWLEGVLTGVGGNGGKKKTTAKKKAVAAAV